MAANSSWASSCRASTARHGHCRVDRRDALSPTLCRCDRPTVPSTRTSMMRKAHTRGPGSPAPHATPAQGVRKGGSSHASVKWGLRGFGLQSA
eukprot:189804-Prorocentrum_minimum.AAC.1